VKAPPTTGRAERRQTPGEAPGTTAATRIERWVRPEIRALGAYPVPDATGLVKLDAMENPWFWPRELRGHLGERLAAEPLNRYPDPHADALREILRERMGVPAGSGLLLGNGSDEIIQMLALLLGGPGRTILSLEPGFVMYRMISLFAGSRYLGLDLTPERFDIDLEALLDAIERERPALVFLACPNNPTGNLFAPAAVEAVLRAAPGVVVVDEAYSPFTDRSLLPRLPEFPNLLLMRTFSKMGLAGLRLGWIAGAPEWIAELDKVRLPYNINRLTQTAAHLALEHLDLFAQQTRAIREQRGRLFQALSRRPGLRVWPSEANFLLFRAPDGPGLFTRLRDHGVLLKNLHGAHPLLRDCLRVTVGTPEENQTFMRALDLCLSGAESSLNTL